MATLARMGSLITKDRLVAINGWDDLTDAQKGKVEAETKLLAASMADYTHSKLAIGEHLYNIREVLEPKKLWVRFLRTVFVHVSERTAYRYINGYQKAKKLLPDNVLKFVAARGLNMVGDGDKPLGEYTQAVKRLPPPKTDNPSTIREWVDNVVAQKKAHRRARQARTIEGDPETILQESMRFINSRFARLPKRAQATFKKKMAAFIETLGEAEVTEAAEAAA